MVQRRSVYLDNSTPSFEQQDSAKTIFYYDNQKRLVKRQHYDLKRRLKPNFDKRKGKQRDRVIYDEDFEDFEDESSWDITSEIFYKYDSLGKIIEFYAPYKHWDRQNRYIWSYYENGKIKEYRSYEHERLIWVENYSYSDTVYQFTRTWYDYNGNPKHLNENSWEYSPQVTHIYRLDSHERIIEETVINEKGNFLYKTVTEYNSLGFVSTKVRYNENNEPNMTHIYKYKE